MTSRFSVKVNIDDNGLIQVCNPEIDGDGLPVDLALAMMEAMSEVANEYNIELINKE